MLTSTVTWSPGPGIKKYFLLLVVGVILVCSWLGDATRVQAFDPLVSCGNEVAVSYKQDTNEICYTGECTVCGLQIMGMRFMKFLVIFMVLVAALLFANAGVLYVLAPASSSNVGKAHSLFRSAFFGIIIILIAWLLVDTIMRFMMGSQNVASYGPWNEILCKNASDVHCVKKLKPMELVPDGGGSILDQSGLDCERQLGGTCVVLSRVGCGGPVRSDTSCTVSDSQKVCCLPTSSGDSCIIASTGKPGTCQTFEICSSTETNGEVSEKCKDPLICCPIDKTILSCKEDLKGFCAVDEAKCKQYSDNYTLNKDTKTDCPSGEGCCVNTLDVSCKNPPSLKIKYGGAGPVDAPGLQAMIACYKSDPAVSHLLNQQVYTFDQSHPTCNYTNGQSVCESCSHSQNSCHYGRGSGQGAMAADFNGTNESALCSAIKARQGACGGVVLCESNHTHVSLGSCGGS